jgi:hypothetical protein
MGNDGGSIPDRTSQIRVRKRKRRINKAEIQKTKSNLCSMTKEQLRKPIVGDRLGQLYNKTSVIEYLLNKNKAKGFEHIKSLKNVKDLKCIINDNGYIQCQISQEEFSGLNKFFFLWTCGCVFSKTAMDELNIKNKCINCNIDFDINKDLISLNYSKKAKREILKSLLNIKKNNNIDGNNIIKDLKYKDGNDEVNLLRHKTKRNKEI